MNTISKIERKIVRLLVLGRCLFFLCLNGLWAANNVPAATPLPVADPNAAAAFEVTDQVLRPADKIPPLGVLGWGSCGGIEWAANNFVSGSGNEPIWYRQMFRVTNCGTNWFEVGIGGTSRFGLVSSGFFSGADLRIYRLVDKEGKSLPNKPTNMGEPNYDVSLADHVLPVGVGQIIPEGTAGFPDGGWVATSYGPPRLSWVRHGNLCTTDVLTVENGQTYWYVVVAVGPDEQQSEYSNEASARPMKELDDSPHILLSLANRDITPLLKIGSQFTLQPGLYGGVAPYTWTVVDEQGQPTALPDGLTLDKTNGVISGSVKMEPQDLPLRLRVTDAKGRSDTRTWIVNPTTHADAATVKTKLQPPQDLKAVAGNGCVTLKWKASPSPNVAYYQILRSTVPKAQQMERVYVTDNTSKLEKLDYVVVSRRFNPFEMRYINPRVRGIGSPIDMPNWYWRSDSEKLSFALVPHPKPVPAEMVDPGETCLRITASTGRQSIRQPTFIGTEGDRYESSYYGQLEPGKQYALEVWLRQEGLDDNSTVTFDYTTGYPDIHQTFHVTGEWKKYVYTFVGPERPKKVSHISHRFSFTGPGTLWMDNCRIFRVDQPTNMDTPYVPNATILNELIASQPATGPKGVHRDYIISQHLTMSNLLSWHANSTIAPDWDTRVNPTANMTIPMALTFDLQTGDSPQTRMRPWLTIPHIIFSEQDWLNFIEYLAAPYDPAHDTPQTKPWAYQRCQQRGVGTPWTDEFSQITIEFGNETWHNGLYADWFGFGLFLHIAQGGKEYGLFTRYLCETMMQSPYWKTAQLDKKIRFSLGAFYDGGVTKGGKVTGYGEEAIQANPYATVLGHANYVGPKWETGEKSGPVFDDHAAQATLLGFVVGLKQNQTYMSEAWEALAKSHHAYDIAAYEGGPSGYTVRNNPSPGQTEANEKQGKSLAMGVAALDTWLGSYSLGWTDQMYSGYGQGYFWTSHTSLGNGFRPTCSWEALTMRNHLARGDLMVVNEKSCPTILWDKKTYPLIGVYAMRDKNRWCVFVLSRKLDGKHDGFDYGDGATPLTLNLPIKSATAITLHKLTGDPRESNIEKMNISIQSQNIPAVTLKDGSFVVNEATGGDKNGMPPGSIYLYEFEGTL